MNRFGRYTKVILVVGVVMAGMMTFSFVRSQEVTSEPEGFVMSDEAAQQFADTFDATFDGPDLDKVDEVFAADYVGHLPLTADLDRDGLKAYIQSFYDAFPDMTQEVNEIIVGKEFVVLRVTYTGTHNGLLFGIPATGKPVTMAGTGVFRFNEAGKVVENWANLDVVGVLAQIGAFPPPPAA